MASLSLRTPAPFNFRKPEEWKKWRSRFEQYRLASGLSKESAERQVSSLLYCMGEDAEAVLAKVNAGISGQRTIPDTSCIAPKNESTRTHFSIFIIPIRIAIHSRNFKAIRCFVTRLA